jgi:mitochondrial fission protein ELM1
MTNIEQQVKNFHEHIERQRTQRLARGNLNFQNGSYVPVGEQMERKRRHPEIMRQLNEFFGKER